MTNDLVNFDTLVKMACEEICRENAALFDSLDVSGVTVSAKTKRLYKKALKKALLTNSGWYKCFKKTAIACVIAAAVIFGAVLSFEPVRARVWKLVTKKYTDCVEIAFEEDADGEVYSYIAEIKLPELPADWTMRGIGVGGGPQFSYEIKTAGGGRIFYYQAPKSAKRWLDNSEHTVEERILKNRQNAYIFKYENGFMSLAWQDDYTYCLDGYGVTEEELMLLADSIK